MLGSGCLSDLGQSLEADGWMVGHRIRAFVYSNYNLLRPLELVKDQRIDFQTYGNREFLFLFLSDYNEETLLG